jgi:TPR repeat protein
MNAKQSLVTVSLAATFVFSSTAQAMDPAQQMAAYMALSQGNYAAAIPGLKKLADEGDAQSQSTLGTIFWNGMPGVPQDRASAIEYYERAAQKYNGAALSALGNIYLNGDSVPRDPQKAFDYLQKSVTQGTNTGKIGLAVCYLKGWGTEQNLEKSFMYTREAAMQKVPGAAYNLAYYFRRGIGCDVNMVAANKWFAIAAPLLIREAYQKKGSYEHQIAMAEMYTNGWGVPKDPKKAAAYFALGLPLLKKAMTAGKSNAVMTMAELTSNGWGVKKDSAGAEALYKQAVSMGDKEAEWVLAKKSHVQ